MREIYTLSFIILLCSGNAYAQIIESVHGTVKLDKDLNLLYTDAQKANLDTRYVLGLFQQIPSEKDLEKLARAGYQIQAFVPPASYIIKVKQAGRSMQDLKDQFDYVFQIPDELKLSRRMIQDSNYLNQLPVEVLVSVYDIEDMAILDSLVLKWGVRSRTNKWLPETSRILKLEYPLQFEVFLSASVTAQMDIYRGEPQPESNSNSLFCNQILALNYDEIGPTGRGTFFSNIEYFGNNSKFKLNTKGRNHLQFGTGFNGNTTTLQQSHGSQVSLYAASSNNVNEYEDRGMAPGATLVQMPSYDSIENYYSVHKLQPLTLNVSAGTGTSTLDYNVTAKEFDRLTRTLKGFLVCFAAGNDGDTENPHLNYGPGWANISSDDKTTKNNFTVHAAALPGEHFDWACKGPTSDGRLKPDISAEGRFGTSFASPNLAGLVNVLYESYTETYGGIPRSDVVKAVILNTAIDADKPGIDFKTGFGTLNPVGAHTAIKENRIFTGVIQQGSQDSKEVSLFIPEGTAELKVLLYWHDFEGTPGAAKALVNDLDLQMITPEAHLILPWTLDATPGMQYNLPLRKRDSLNNVEQITIINPEPGNYLIRIKGSFVPIGPQEFVLTHEIKSESIKISSPVRNFRTARNKPLLITWNSAIDTTDNTALLDIFFRSGEDNEVLLGTVPASQHYFSYNIPGTASYTSSARIIVKQRNTHIADTSHYFHIMKTPDNLKISGFCMDKVSLKWDPIPIPGTRYYIYRLGEKNMELIDSVDYPASERMILAQNILGNGLIFEREEWFAISARHPNGAKSLRSEPVSVIQTNLLNTHTHISKDYTLCFGDSVVVRALDLLRDSMRWFYLDSPLDEGNIQIQIKGADPGDYYYKIYQPDGCVFVSDTFYVNGPLLMSDTARYGHRVWNVNVFRLHDRQQYYGKATIRALSLRSLDHYSEFDQINEIDSYEGCRPGFTYTIDYKRKGFTRGYYKFDLRFIQESMRLFIDGILVYTSPSNNTNLGVIWEAFLDENSIVKVEQKVLGKPLMDLQILPSNLIHPAEVSDSLLIWLKAEDVILNSEGKLTNWLDTQVNSQQNTADSLAEIHLNPGIINYNDAVSFGAKGGIYGSIPSFFSNEASTIAVFRMDSTSDSNARVLGFGLPPYYSDNNYSGTYSPFHRDASSQEIGLNRNGNLIVPEGNRMNKWQLMSVNIQQNQTQISSKGIVVKHLTHPFEGLFYRSYSIGCSPDTSLVEGRMQGNIAEIIHYKRSLTTAEEHRMYTYLALKYGLTLDIPYRGPDNIMLFTPDAYRYQIAGIARNDAGGWCQKQSKSEESIPDVFVGSLGAIAATNFENNNQFDKDSSYIIWGHNGQNPEFFIFQNDSTSRMLRAWKYQHTGKTGIFRFNFSGSDPNFQDECATYTLLLDDQTDFENAVMLPLQKTFSADGSPYWSAEFLFDSEGIGYFTIEKTIIDQIRGPLAQQSVSSGVYCIQDDTYLALDSAQQIIALAQTEVLDDVNTISELQVRTNADPNLLAKCSDQLAQSVFNRMISLRVRGNGSGIVNIKLFMDPEDSLRAANNLQLLTNICNYSELEWRWWAEPDLQSVLSKIQNQEELNYLSNEQVVHNPDHIPESVEFVKLPLQNMVLGAILTSKETTSSSSYPGISKIKVFPVPFQTHFTVNGLDPGDNIYIYDIHGRCVFRSPASSVVHQVESNTQSGFYILKVERNNKIIYTDKLVNIRLE